MSNIRSMTGFGRAEGCSEPGSLTVEIKSVNHRFLDARVHLPRDLSLLEIPLVKQVKSRLERGKVEVSVKWFPSPEMTGGVTFNQNLVARYEADVDHIAAFLHREEEKVSLEYLLSLPGAIEKESNEDLSQAVGELAAEVLEKALDALVAEREREGVPLADEISSRLDALQKYQETVAERRQEVVDAYRERLTKRAGEWAQSASVELDKGRIESEILVFVERSDIQEELVRLEAHIQAFRDLLVEERPSKGKPMEFLTQELLRETNTIASKGRDTSINSLVLEMKNEIEKIREQVMNIE
ncbi:MAG: YicC/YloC family endoribonuclease [Candidatus Sumerlaeota bacterium]